ncbi:MAG: DNA-3-methyladenine glycosylase [Candidatus Woesebacteria bacterium GW2011_GWC2_45_9]|uniref:DNA-(apurinic or apyrimidinic site) lyase n=2 Tax=Microgenomates group TaxID=1794810 RepID=A0A0G1QE58_9BACT|nr:MAG: DNA-3-methyladenine glycosylase [Candidatus Woesebacteria bacterium GW2011_GWC2_45_9]
MKLKEKYILEIIPTLPFHFNSTFYKPGHFPSNDTRWESGKRWQTMLWGGKRLGIIYKDGGSKKNPKVVAEIYSASPLTSEFLENLKNEIIWRFNLNLDLREFYKYIGNDPLLKSIIKKFYGLRPMSYSSLYEYLIIGIMLQNTVVRRSVSMLQSLFEKYGTLLEYDRVKLWCHWEPKVMATANEEELRALKVGYRAKSLIKVSEPFAQEEINEIELRNKSNEEQEKILLSLYGVGPQTLGYIMLDGLHHWDYIRNISPWEQKIYSRIFFNKELVPVDKMLRRFGKWGKWKGLAVHYVWEDIWWKRRNKHISWLEKLIRL